MLWPPTLQSGLARFLFGGRPTLKSVVQRRNHLKESERRQLVCVPEDVALALPIPLFVEHHQAEKLDHLCFGCWWFKMS